MREYNWFDHRVRTDAKGRSWALKNGRWRRCCLYNRGLMFGRPISQADRYALFLMIVVLAPFGWLGLLR